MSQDLKAIAYKFAEMQIPHLGKPTSPPLDWALRSNTEMVVILADGRKMILDPTQPITKPQPPSEPRSELAQLLARIQELEQRLAGKDNVNVEDGVDDAEAQLAGKALQARKNKKKE